MNKFFNNKFSKLACTHVMSVFWNRLLTYSKLQKYLLLITVSLSLGMICIGRKYSKQHAPASGFYETKETTELREIVEGFEEIFRTMVEMRANSQDEIKFFESIGLSNSEEGKQEFSRDTSRPYPLTTYDLLGARMQSFLMNKQYYRFLVFSRLGWSYIKGILLESQIVKILKLSNDSEGLLKFWDGKILRNNLKLLNGDGYFNVISRVEDVRKKPLTKEYINCKTDIILDFINKRLDDAKLLDEYNLSRGTSKKDLDQSTKRAESLENLSSWMEEIEMAGMHSSPIRLPPYTKWSYLYVGVMKRLLRDEIARISEKTSSVEEDLTRRKDDFSHVQEKRQERQKKYKRELFYYDVTEYAINVDSNLNDQEKLIMRLLLAQLNYIRSMLKHKK